MSEPKLLLGSTQTLLCYAEVNVDGVIVRGQPSACTVRIGTPAVTMPLDGEGDPATIDTLSTDLTGDAEDGHTQLAVTEATFVRGRRYLVDTPTGEQGVVRSRTSGASDTLDVAEPLPFEAVTGSTIKGYAVSIPLTADQTALEGPAIAMWRATIDGVVHEWAQPFRVVRRVLVATLTEDELTTSWPIIRQIRSRTDPALDEIIAAAWKHRVLPWLEAQSIDEEDVISAAALEPLHAVGCVLQLGEGNAQVSAELVERWQKRWESIASTTLARKSWHEQPQVEQPAPRADVPAKPRSGPRLVR